jgi:hypothetical protein
MIALPNVWRITEGNRMRRTVLVLALASAIAPLAALADSTTGTSLSIVGSPHPGGKVSAHVVVNGKHLVSGPGFTVDGGFVQVLVNGVVVAQAQAAWPANSNQIDYGCVQYDDRGNCVRIKHISDNTDVTLPITLPTGSATAQITAQYTGDKDSHSSQSPALALALNVKPDLYLINPNNTGSGMTEVHILDSSTGFTTYKLHAASALGQFNPDQIAFAIGDANGDGTPDVYAISRYGNGTPNVEVHILDGASNFGTFLGHYSTSLPAVEGALAWTFDVGDFDRDGKPDLYVFKKVGGNSGKTEVHIYSGADGFKTALGHFALPTPSTGNDDAWEFHVADVDLDGIPDVVAVAKQNGAMTEVHTISGASNYATYTQETATGLHTTGTDSRWVFGFNDYDADGKADMFAMNKMGTQGVEVHILKGNTYQDFLLHGVTPSGMLPPDSSKTLLINK